MTIVEYCCAGARWLPEGRHTEECEGAVAVGCDCGNECRPCARPGASHIHKITCATVATTGEPHAMVDTDGDVWYPDDADDARAFFDDFGAVPIDRERFPFPELLPLFPPEG